MATESKTKQIDSKASISAKEVKSTVSTKIEESRSYGSWSYSDSQSYHDHGISYSTFTKVSYFVQFIVVAGAASTFAFIFYLRLGRLQHTRVLESKEVVAYNEPWFKFAVCLRPFITTDLLKEVYLQEFNTTFADYLKTRNGTPTSWTPHTWLDYSLASEDYIDYFQNVHPWGAMDLNKLWDFQHLNVKRVFRTISVNRITLTENTVEKSRIKYIPDLKYTVLMNKKLMNSTKADYSSLLGDYTLSPLYAGCVNVTVNESMAERQMEIVVNTRDYIFSVSTLRNRVHLYKVADLFVFQATEQFTEIPSIQKLKRYSMNVNAFQRLVVKGELYEKESTTDTPCNNEKGYSKINCRYWCIMRQFLSEIECHLPWMKDVIRKPWLEKKHRELKLCANTKQFLSALSIQKKYFHIDGGYMPKSVVKCLEDCYEPCTSYKVQLFTLGSKSIGSQFGMSLTVSADVDTVKERADYTILTMVAELSASISFLLGLSAIAIYDWLIALGVWSSVRLGLYNPVEGGDDDATNVGIDETKSKEDNVDPERLVSGPLSADNLAASDSIRSTADSAASVNIGHSSSGAVESAAYVDSHTASATTVKSVADSAASVNIGHSSSGAVESAAYVDSHTASATTVKSVADSAASVPLHISSADAI